MPRPAPPKTALPAFLHPPLADFIACLRFYSRLPLPVFAFETAPHAMLDFRRAITMLPFAGAALGALGAVALLLGRAIGASPLVAATLAVAALVVITGAMQEDGLADVADGFGGGRDRARKLEIMKDSRIGAYGGAALALALALRIEALADLADRSLAQAALALIAVGAVSRLLGLLPLLLLPPARADGAGFSAPRPTWLETGKAALIATVLALAPVLGGMPEKPILLAIVLAGLAAWGVVRLAAWQIGGQTGDVAGAAQQAAEIAFLVMLSARGLG